MGLWESVGGLRCSHHSEIFNPSVLNLLSVVRGLLFSFAGVGVQSGGGGCCFALFVAIMTEGSAAAYFCCSHAIRVLSATTRFGFFSRCVGARAGFVACCVISTCECAVCVSPSDCSVDIVC